MTIKGFIIPRGQGAKVKRSKGAAGVWPAKLLEKLVTQLTITPELTIHKAGQLNDWTHIGHLTTCYSLAQRLIKTAQLRAEISMLSHTKKVWRILLMTIEENKWAFVALGISAGATLAALCLPLTWTSSAVLLATGMAARLLAFAPLIDAFKRNWHMYATTETLHGPTNVSSRLFHDY